ncbi:MAG: 2-amino-4-hydroxy-6-hydroxymethyldihydropteridine diphosphokinase [Sutterellaceae bacterium]|nr:2-amino-4-hydroxy-6-hydroxymethyldihydropteridine diphosphokinase [Sutterellaceae bacterium]
MSEKQAFVALGANLGEPVAALKRALAAIAEIEGTSVVRVSSFYSTAPIDSSGPDYVNAVCEVATTLEPQALLHALQCIENDNGRVRPVGVHNAPRTLDLDVLLFDGQTIQTPELTVPHPRMHLRAFVLVPLVEIAPEVEIPGLGKARDYLDSVADQEISKL